MILICNRKNTRTNATRSHLLRKTMVNSNPQQPSEEADNGEFASGLVQRTAGGS
jgi:hypothetical protein